MFAIKATALVLVTIAGPTALRLLISTFSTRPLYASSDDANGEMLIDTIQWDYEVFEDGLYSSDRAAGLLEDILATRWDDDSGESPVRAHELYRRSWAGPTMLEEWTEYCGDVKEHPDKKPDLPALFDEEVGRQEAEVRQGTILYRARPGFNKVAGIVEPYASAEIGAPPPDKVTQAGRANKQGESVLYIADQEATAVAETRPARGLLVSVAQVHVVRDLRLVDLHKPVRPSNPFIDDIPRYELELENLLRAFGEELSRPLRRTDDHHEYLPCQKLVERIRESGLYDGIRYPSAMAPGGSNIVLFASDLVAIGASKLVEIREVSVSYLDFDDEDGWPQQGA